MIETFRILVVSDFSGRGSRSEAGGTKLAARPRSRVDRDTFDELFASLAPRLRLDVPGSGSTELTFAALDDFRPESLAERLPAVATLQRLRARLVDPARFAGAREEARTLLGQVVAAPAVASAPPRVAPAADLLMEDLLAASERQRSERASDFRARVLAAIGPELSDATRPARSAEQKLWVEAADLAVAGIVNSVLHARAFQALEAAWRGLLLLVRRLATDEDVTVSVLDARVGELVEDASVFLEREAGAPRWSLVVLDTRFAATPVSVAALESLAEGAASGGVALVTGSGRTAASPAEGLAAWDALRTLPAAMSLALVAPRVLLRLPYGAATDPVDGFAFEETLDGRDALLWGNGAFVAACAVGTGFGRDPDDPCGSAAIELDDLPCFSREADGGRTWQPPGESVVDAAAAEALIAAGVMPLRCAPRDTSVHLRGVFPFAGAERSLRGPWA